MINYILAFTCGAVISGLVIIIFKLIDIENILQGIRYNQRKDK